jgi:polyhydroxyalkanoate synthase
MSSPPNLDNGSCKAFLDHWSRTLDQIEDMGKTRLTEPGRDFFVRVVGQLRSSAHMTQHLVKQFDPGPPEADSKPNTDPISLLWQPTLDAWQRCLNACQTGAPSSSTTGSGATSDALGAYADTLAGIGQSALSDLARRIEQHAQRGGSGLSLRELYELWVESGEDAYRRAVSTDEFARQFAALLHAALRPENGKLPGAPRHVLGGFTTESEPGAEFGALRELLTLEGIRDELDALQRTLAEGIKTLRGIGEIDVGSAPKDQVLEHEGVRLYRYQPTTEQRVQIPLLIVYSLTNRHYMTDLQEDRSMIRGLLAQGVVVYLIEWDSAECSGSPRGLDDYADRYLDRCVDVVRHAHHVERVSVLGICQGGIFSLCYASLYPYKVHALITMVTPVDFHTSDDLLSRWVRYVDMDVLAEQLGAVVPGELLNWVFLALKPLQLMGKKYIDMVDLFDNPAALKNFLRMEKWIYDNPAQWAGVFKEFVQRFYQRNELIAGQVELGGRRIQLANISMPVLNIYSTRDHIVPPASSMALGRYVSSEDYETLAFPGGHIGIYVSRRACSIVPPHIGQWLARHA